MPFWSSAPPRVLSSQYAASDQMTAATLTTEQNFATSYTFPANYFVAGKAVEAHVGFLYASAATVPNMTIQFKLGGTNVWKSTSQTLSGTLGTGLPFAISVHLAGTGAPGASVGVHCNFLGPYAGVSAFSVSQVTTQPVLLATNGSLQFQVSVTYAATSAGNSLNLATMLIQEWN